MTQTNSKKPLWVRAINGINEASGYISGLLILVSSLVICHAVAVRYFFGLPSYWQTELSIYLLMFTTFIGGAYALKHNAHVGVDILSIKLSPRANLILRVITAVICLVFTLIVAWRAGVMWWDATSMGWKSDTLWGPKLTFPYAILPLGMILTSLQYLALIYEDTVAIKNSKNQPASTDASSGHTV